MKFSFKYNLLLLVLLFVSPIPAYAEIYKWVDEKGKVHFSSKPPAHIKKANKSVKQLNLRRTPSRLKPSPRSIQSSFNSPASNSPILSALSVSKTEAINLIENSRGKISIAELAYATKNQLNDVLQAMLDQISTQITAPEYLKLSDGMSLLDIAAVNGNTEGLKMLMQKDMHRFRENMLGLSALVHAIQNEQPLAVNTLIAFGIDINGVDSIAMKKVAETGNLEIAKILLRNNGQVNTSNTHQAGIGRIKNVSLSPLALAVKNAHFDMVKLLVENGANINVRNKSYGTALDLAKKQNNDPIIRYLSLHGAKTSKEARRSRNLTY